MVRCVQMRLFTCDKLMMIAVVSHCYSILLPGSKTYMYLQLKVLVTQKDNNCIEHKFRCLKPATSKESPSHRKLKKWFEVACEASISVWFQSKERPRNGIFCFGSAKNGARACFKIISHRSYVTKLKQLIT